MAASGALRLFTGFSGIAVLVWAVVDPRFRDSDGFLVGGVCLAGAVGVGLLIVGWTSGGPSWRFGLWLALALVGQAVALQLIEAGRAVRYQHYTPLVRLVAERHPALILYLALQATLVVAGLGMRWGEIRAWAGRTFSAWQLLAIGAIFVLSSATVSRELGVYLAELPFAAFVQAVNLGNVVLLAWALPGEALRFWRAVLDRVLGTREEGTPQRARVDWFPVVLGAVWVTLVASALSVFVYGRHPHVPDEVAYLYHARFLASGALTLPPPPVPDAFHVYLMEVEGGRWYSSTPPGWPLVLALGVLLGVPWLVNPLLAGLNTLLAYGLLSDLYDRPGARMGVLLLVLSPWHVFMAMNFMAHTFTLTCALAAAVAVGRARRTGRATWGWLAGAATGMASLIRPLDGLILAVLLGLWAIGLGGRRLKVSAIAAFVAGVIVVGAATLPYNALLAGAPTVFPLNAYLDKHFGPNSNAYGFGPERGMGWPIDPFPGHGPVDALVNANLNTFSVNIELFGWSTGSLLLMGLALVSVARRRSDLPMVAVLAAVFVAYFFYYFSGGPDFGARYWFLMLVPCVALTVRGVALLQTAAEGGPVGDRHGGTRVAVAVLALSLLALVNYFPWRAIDKYHHYLGMRPDIPRLAAERGFGRSLVLVRGPAHPDYASAAVYNPLDFHADTPVYAWDRNPAVRARVLEAYPDRPVWVVDGPSLTGGSFRVMDGPLWPRQAKDGGSLAKP